MRQVFWVAVLAVLLSCSTQETANTVPVAATASPAASTVTIETSANDKRQYAYRQLPNGMKVVLVSDPEAPKSAASLDVFVGSGHDPKDRQGLAHFLEHMLFLGTDKYPQPDEYQAFVSAHGGSYNAYTSYEHTNYFFNIEHKAFAEGLDRFAQFFIAPRFDATYVEREKNAVNSEYQARIRDEGRRGLDVFLQVANPEHPLNRFSIGSLETLADRDGRAVRDDLLAFYQRYYSASVMALTIVSNQPLAELESLASGLFSAVPARPVDRELAKQPIFRDGTLPMRVNLTPEQEVRELTLVFPVPEALPYYRTKPLDYINNLLGHEGEGSLLSWLKHQGWVDSLAAGAGFNFTNGAAVTIDIGLTEQGLDHVDDIVTAVFQALQRIREEGVNEWRYQEQATMNRLHFRYMEKSHPDDFAIQVSNNLHHYPAQEVLRGDYLMESFPEQQVREYLQHLVPDNVLVMVSAKGLPTDRVTEWFKVPYRVQAIAPKTLVRWRQPDVNTAITLPSPNAYLPQQFALVEASGKKPVQVKTVDGLSLWVMSDAQFGVPRGHVKIALFNPAMSQTVQDAAKRDLYTALLSDRLRETLYPAWLAGMGFELSAFDRGIMLSVSGFTDKQADVLAALVKALQSVEVDALDYARIHDAYIRSGINSARIMPFRRLVNGVNEATLPLQWSGEQLAEAAKPLAFADVRDYGQAFLRQVSVDMLVYGNYEATHWAGLMDAVQPLVTSTEALPLYRPRGYDKGHREAIRMPVLHDDAAVLRYVPGESTSVREAALFALTGQALQSDFFHQLRTEQQLGYVVYAGAYPVLQYPGMMFVVQSPTHDAKAIVAAMDGFMGKALAEVDRDEFDRHRRSLIGRYREPPTNLSEMADRLWDERMRYRSTRFDRRERMAFQLERITYDDWQAFVRRMVTGESRRELLLYAPGKAGVAP